MNMIRILSLCRLRPAQTYFGMKGAVSNIDVTLDSDTHLREVRKAIEESVGAGAYIYDWKQTIRLSLMRLRSNAT